MKKKILAFLLAFSLALPFAQGIDTKAAEIAEPILSEEIAPVYDIEEENDETLEGEDFRVYSDGETEEYVWENLSKYSSVYLYGQMTDAQKMVYDALKEACDNFMYSTKDATLNTATGGTIYHIGKITFDGTKISNSDAAQVAKVFMFQNPQYFFINSVTYKYKEDGNITLGVYPAFAYGNDRKEAYEKMLISLHQIEQDMQNLVNAYTTDYQLEYHIYSYVLDRLYYRSNTYDQSIYSTLIPSTNASYDTVCAGYAKLFLLCARYVGFNCVGITSANHGWNKIQIDGEWYNVDATWDDVSPRVFTWFNKSDDTFAIKQEHTCIDVYNSLLPKCDKNYAEEVLQEEKGMEEEITPEVQEYSLTYRTYVQTYGWLDYVSSGQTSGTSGEAKRMEAIQIKLAGDKNSSIVYRTYIQKQGWEKEWVNNGKMSGTKGLGYRLEAIQIKLKGDITKENDVYYRVYAQSYGWLGWAKNGKSAGTAGLSKRLEAIQIKLVGKNDKAPKSTKEAYVKAQ